MAIQNFQLGMRGVCVVRFEDDADVIVGDGKVAFTVPSFMDGFDLVEMITSCHTKGTSGTTDVQVRRRREGSEVDVLSTKVTHGDEFHCSDGVINTSNDDVATGDQYYWDVDSARTGMKGLSVVSTFVKP